MPTYAHPPTSFDELIAPFPAEIREVALALREMILRRIPAADELVSGGVHFANALYSLGAPTNVACGISPAASHCKLYLHHVKPGDVAGVKIEGSGKSVRHIKLKQRAELDSLALHSALEIACSESAARADGP